MAGAGVHRTLRLVRELGALGYRPVVLTIDERSIRESGVLRDESLLQEIPEGVTVIRTRSHEPVRLKSALLRIRVYRLAWFVLFPMLWEGAAMWKRSAVPAALSAISDHGIELLYTTSGPFSSLGVGCRIKARTDLPWVADLRDPYTDAYAWRWPSKLHWLCMRQWERRVFRRPDRIVVTSDATKRLLVERGVASAATTEVITNAF